MEKTSLPDPGALHGRHIVLGVTGGIAAYKAVEICRRLVDEGARVSPVLSANATHFVGSATFAALASDRPVVELWDNDDPSPHTSLGQAAELILVAPATARVIASLAHGIADDALATTLLATRAAVVVCPAMHTEMWEHPAVQANVATLRERGVIIFEPEDGPLAGGDSGVGRLAAVESIIGAVREILGTSKKDLVGRQLLVTAGGTREPIDAVRFIGNRSSGRQGYAVAVEGLARGANVTLVTASPLPPPMGVRAVRVQTAKEMHTAVMEHLEPADVVVMAAAVADFRPATVSDAKLKKADGVPVITLEPTIDILADIAERRRGKQVVVGFAAEVGDLEMYGQEKLARKKLDLIVANDVSRDDAGIDAENNEALIIAADGEVFATGLVEKRTVAAALLDRVAILLDR